MEIPQMNLEKLSQEVATLRQQLAETQERLNIAEETLQAIHSGEVDAVIVSTSRGTQVFTLQGADYIYQCLVDQMNEGAATASSDGFVLYCNKQLAELLNYPLKNLIGSQLENFIVPQDRNAFLNLLQQIKEGETLTQDLSLICAARGQGENQEKEPKKNTEIPVKLSLRQFKLDELLVNSIVITDITESKVKEAAKLTQILNRVIAAITSYRFFPDHTWEFEYWSDSCEILLGYTAVELMAEQTLWASRVEPQDLEIIVERTFASLQKNKTSNNVEYRFRHKNENLIWLSASQSFEWNETDHYWVVNTVLTDITEKKQLEQQFYHAQRLESLGTLASGIAHDFNNILTPILGVTQLLPLEFPNLDERTESLLTMLSSSARRGADLVKQILLFSRAPEGQSVILQLGYLLREVIGISKQTFSKLIDFSVDVPTRELWTISADATQMQQVFMNLLINARDAMPDGGVLKITARNLQLSEDDPLVDLELKSGAYVVVTVTDTGTGIPPELLSRIFDPFFTTKDIGKGTGLGLSTVTGIVKNHGGLIKVHSELGKGTEFKIFLPAEEGEIMVIASEKSMPRGNGELILIVDDEAPIRDLLVLALESYNYRTVQASDGIGAIALYGKYQQEISVVLMDMMMPNLDGATTISTLRSLNPQVKIVASSGLIDNRQLAIDAHANAFLAKPYTAKELLQMLEEILESDENKENLHASMNSQRDFPLPKIELSKESLTIMPSLWLQQMYDAAYFCDAEVMLELIAEIPNAEAAIATALKDLVLDFKMDTIMELTK